MLFSNYFSAMTDKVKQIKNRIAKVPAKEKMTYYKDVMDLREISDTIVEEWLQFEEQLVELQRMFEEESALETGEPNTGAAGGGDGEVYLPRPLAAQFRKGQGYFDLSMYDEAVKSFHRIVTEEPDLAMARLYLAFGFLMSKKWDIAYRQFYLLTETTAHPFIRAASYNGMGCVAVLEGNNEQGIMWFQRSLAASPSFHDAAYNLALTYYHARRYEEAVKTGEKLSAVRDNDLELLLLLFHCYAKLGHKEKAHQAIRQAEKEAEIPSDWQQIARGYEQLSMFGEAARCYRRLLPEMRKEAWVWHGLAWSIWQEGQHESALSHFKYALTLSRDEPEFACSYAWVLLRQGNWERSWRIFEQVEQRHGHPLAVAGLIESAFRQGWLGRIKPLCDKLVKDKNRKIQALGHYYTGRWFMSRGEQEEAQRHFSLSQQCGTVPESYLYSGLLHYHAQEHTQAYDRWRAILPVQ